MASRSGPGQAKSMTLWRSFSTGMILRKMMSRNASLTDKPCPLTHTSPCTTEGSPTKRCLDLRLPPWSAKCWSFCGHNPWSYRNGQPCGPLYGIQHRSRPYVLYMQRTATPMTNAHGHCILLLFSSCAAFSAACTQSATATLAHPAGSTTPE